MNVQWKVNILGDLICVLQRHLDAHVLGGLIRAPVSVAFLVATICTLRA